MTAQIPAEGAFYRADGSFLGYRGIAATLMVDMVAIQEEGPPEPVDTSGRVYLQRILDGEGDVLLEIYGVNGNNGLAHRIAFPLTEEHGETLLPTGGVVARDLVHQVGEVTIGGFVQLFSAPFAIRAVRRGMPSTVLQMTPNVGIMLVSHAGAPPLSLLKEFIAAGELEEDATFDDLVAKLQEPVAEEAIEQVAAAVADSAEDGDLHDAVAAGIEAVADREEEATGVGGAIDDREDQALAAIADREGDAIDNGGAIDTRENAAIAAVADREEDAIGVGGAIDDREDQALAAIADREGDAIDNGGAIDTRENAAIAAVADREEDAIGVGGAIDDREDQALAAIADREGDAIDSGGAIDTRENAAIAAVADREEDAIGVGGAIDDREDLAIDQVNAAAAARIVDINAVPGSEQYASTADALSKGVWSVGITAGGSGGANGVYYWTTTGGAGAGASGYLVVSGGAITTVAVTHRGAGYTSAPTIVIAGSHGVTGHTLAPVISQNKPAGAFFIVKVASGFAVYVVDAGGATATLQETYLAYTAAVEAFGENLAPLYDLIRKDAAQVFARGTYTTGHATINAALKGWRSPFKHDGTAFNVAEFTCKASAANTRVLVKILDSAYVEIARGYGRVGTTLETISVTLNKVVRELALNAIGFFSYEPADAGGVLNYPGGAGSNTYPGGDANTAVYLEKYLSSGDVWTTAGPAGNYCIPFRLMLYTGQVERGVVPSLSAAVTALQNVIASGSVTIWDNPGFTGYDTVYTQHGVGTKTSTLATAATFNTLTVYGGCPGAGVLRAYIVDPATSSNHVPSTTDTLLFERAISWTSGALQRVLELDGAYTVPAGKQLHVLWVASTSGQWVSIAQFTADPGAAAPVIRLTTSGAGVPATAFASSWGDGNRSFCTVPPLLTMSLPGQATTLDVPYFTIPAVINAVVGTELNLYYDAIFSAHSDGLAGFKGYSVAIIGTKGQNKQRGFRFTPQAGDIGTTAFVAYAWDAAGNLVATKAFSITVIAATPKGSAKNVLSVGDSLTFDGTLTTTVQAKFAALGAVVPTFVGSQGTAPAAMEGRGGKTFAFFATNGGVAYRFTVSGVTTVGMTSTYTTGGVTYTVIEAILSGGAGVIIATGASAPAASGTLTKAGGSGDTTIAFSASATGTANPFWNSGALDIANYRSVHGIAAVIDAAPIMLGINDITLEGAKTPAELTAIVNYGKALCTALLADNASCKILIELPLVCGNSSDGFATNYGAQFSRHFYEKNLFALRAALISAFDASAFHANVKVGSAGLQVDRYYGYARSSVAVAARIATLNDEHSNAVHPNTVGYQQAGDATFADLLAVL